MICKKNNIVELGGHMRMTPQQTLGLARRYKPRKVVIITSGSCNTDCDDITFYTSKMSDADANLMIAKAHSWFTHNSSGQEEIKEPDEGA